MYVNESERSPDTTADIKESCAFTKTGSVPKVPLKDENG